MNNSKKIVLHAAKATNKLLKGVNLVADAVKHTFGPSGNFVMYNKFGSPNVTKDGVTVAKEIDSIDDPSIEMGCELAKKVASDTVDSCGDGTTTATILFQSLCNSAATYSLSGMSATEIANGMNMALKNAIESLKSQSINVDVTSKMLEDVATISSNGDRRIGRQIFDMMNKIGPSGIINVEKGRSTETEFEYVEGMEFDSGYKSPYFLNNTNKQICELESPYILVCDHKLDSINHIKKMVDIIENKINNAPITIIAQEFEGLFLQFLVQNAHLKMIKACAIKTPFGDSQKEILNDIAIFTGAEKISEETGISFDKLDVQHLGRADKIIVSKNNSVIVRGHGNKNAIENRIHDLKEQAENTDSNSAKEKLEKRRAALGGVVCNYKIGGFTEIEQNEIKDRVDDAVRSAKAALEAGILPGGGSSYIRAMKKLQEDLVSIRNEGKSIAFISGYQVVIEALPKPIKQAMENAGMIDKYQLVINNILNGQDKSGFNISADKFEHNMVEAGICDAAKCAISSLEFAVNYATKFVNTQCMITNDIVKASNKDNVEDIM